MYVLVKGLCSNAKTLYTGKLLLATVCDGANQEDKTKKIY